MRKHWTVGWLTTGRWHAYKIISVGEKKLLILDYRWSYLPRQSNPRASRRDGNIQRFLQISLCKIYPKVFKEEKGKTYHFAIPLRGLLKFKWVLSFQKRRVGIAVQHVKWTLKFCHNWKNTKYRFEAKKFQTSKWILRAACSPWRQVGRNINEKYKSVLITES